VKLVSTSVLTVQFIWPARYLSVTLVSARLICCLIGQNGEIRIILECEIAGSHGG
jgi:hypothetical protein